MYCNGQVFYESVVIWHVLAKKVILDEVMVSNKSASFKRKICLDEPKNHKILCSVSEYKWGHIRMFSILCFLVVKKFHREYSPKRPTEDICCILIILYEKNGGLLRAVGARGGGQGLPDFGKSLSPISTGDRFMPTTLLIAPPSLNFQTSPRSYFCVCKARNMMPAYQKMHFFLVRTR